MSPPLGEIHISFENNFLDIIKKKKWYLRMISKSYHFPNIYLAGSLRLCLTSRERLEYCVHSEVLANAVRHIDAHADSGP